MGHQCSITDRCDPSSKNEELIQTQLARRSIVTTSSVQDEEARAFFEEAVGSSGDYSPSQCGHLKLADLERLAKRLNFADLGFEELRRVFDTIPRNANGNVGLDEFMEAVNRGAQKATLRRLVEKLRLGYDYGFVVPSTYNYSKSTNENYKAAHSEFAPEFAEIRRTLDYDFHVNYTMARQEWQDAAIKSVIVRTGEQPAPWLVYTCGPMGVGKGYALGWMSKRGFFPLEQIVHVDPDAFKMMMPEWPKYVEQKQEAGTLCHQESGFMMEIAQEAAMARRQNIWIDGSLRNADFYAGVFRDIRARYPHYRIAIFYVSASEEEIRKRIKIRAVQTGRDVPENLIVASLQAMDRSLNVLTPLTNFVARISNEGAVPALAAFETVDQSGSWRMIQERFARDLKSDIAEFPQHLAPLSLVAMQNTHLALLKKTNKTNFDTGLFSSGYFDTALELTLSGSSSDEVVRKLEAMLPKAPRLAISPEHVLTLSAYSRALAGIPKEAETFFWVYPYSDFSQLSMKKLEKAGLRREDEQTNPLVQLLLSGGFCYCDATSSVCGLVAVTSGVGQGLLQFEEPIEVAPSAIAELPATRLQTITLPYLYARGARKFAWVLPQEIFGGANLGGDHGAFVYVMDGAAALRFPVMQD